MKYVITALLGLLLFAGFAYAAPVFRFERTLLPEADSTYYLGSSSPDRAWRGGYFDELCLTADTCRSSWPVGGSTGSGLSSGTPYTVGQLTWAQTTGLLATVATGTLSESVTGLEFDAARALVGGSATLSLTSGYNIPLTASTTEWAGFYLTPSTRITAGTGIDWSGNTLNGVYTAGDGLTLTSEDFDCDTVTASVFGCLSSADWSLFNNKVSSTSIDTLAEIETLTGVANILIENDIDASSELAALMDDESGTGALIFGTNSTLASTTLTGSTTIQNGTSTNHAITGGFRFGGVAGTSWSDFCTSITGGAGLCDGTDATGGGGADTNWTVASGVLVPTTTRQVAASTFTATSTSATSTFPYASSTVLHAQDLNGVKYANVFGGSDIGAKINAAYAALGSNGGTIYVSPGAYSFSTPINFNTDQKRVLLKCGPGTTFTYTGSATSTFLDYGYTTLNYGQGIDGCGYNSNAGTTSNQIAIQVGGTNGAQGSVISNLKINNFTYGIVGAANSWGVTYDHVLTQNTVYGFVQQEFNNSGEAINFVNSTFADNIYKRDVEKCVWIKANGAASFVFMGGAIDNCGVTIEDGSYQVSFIGTHFENPFPSYYGSYRWIVNNGIANVTLTNPTFVQGATSAGDLPNSYILNAGRMVVSGAAVANFTAAGAPPAFVNNTGSGKTEIYGLKQFGTAGTIATSGISYYVDTTNSLMTFDGTVSSTISRSTNASSTVLSSITGFFTDLFASGNVAIGTTTTANRVSIFSSASSLAGLRVTGGSGSSATANANSGQIVLGSGVASSQGSLGYDWAVGDLFIDNTWNDNQGDIFFRTKTFGATTTGLSILGSGNVGVGTTSPFSTLSVHKLAGTSGTSVFAIASSTASATTTLFQVLNTGSTSIPSLANCDTVDTDASGFFKCGSDATAAGGSGIATSGAIANTEVIYGTGVGTVDSEAAFTYNASTDLLTTTNASTTGVFSALTGYFTNLFIGVDTLAEYIADTAGAFFTGNTETGITVTYQDADNTVDVVCDTASSSVFGCLAAADWSVFNNKVSSTSIDTLAEIETLTGVSNILIENDIDASSELAALMDDETGSGSLVFGTNATLASTTLTGSTTMAAATTTTLGILSLTAVNCDVKANTNGGIYCGTDATGVGSGASPDWIKETNFGADALTPTTTIPVWVKSAFYASSSALFQQTIGIGTTTPSAVLAIAGSSTYPALYIGSTTASRANFIIDAGGRAVFGTSSAATEDGLRTMATFASDTGLDAFTTFQNYSSGRAMIMRIRSASDYARFDVRSQNASWIIGTLGNTNLRFRDDDTGSEPFQIEEGITRSNRLYLDSTGAIGMGTTTPSSLLSLHLNATETLTNIFSIASSTLTSTSTLFSIANTGSTTIANLNAANCDVKATTLGSLYCGTDATGGGGSEINWTFASNRLGIYPSTTTNDIWFGGSSTSTAPFWFDVNATPGSDSTFYIGSTTSSQNKIVGRGLNADNGAALQFFGSDATAGGTGGILEFLAGTGGATDGPGGALTFSGGTGQGAGAGGSLNFFGGAASTGAGGDLIFSPGDGATDGNIYLTDATVDTANPILMARGSNKAVGIGSSTPSSQLSLKGNGLSSLLSIVSNAGTEIMRILETGVVTLLGAWDFGGATSVEIPNGTGPTVDAAGEIALDTTDDQLLVADSGGTVRVMATDEKKIKDVTIASTSIAFVSGGVLPVGSYKDGLELTQYRCYVSGGTSVVLNLSDGTNDTETITCNTTVSSDTDVATNDTFTADEIMNLEFGTITGTVNYVHFEAYARITRE